MFSETVNILSKKCGNLQYTCFKLCSFSGHYCLNGTKVSTEFPCPSGTYNNDTGLRAESECFPCLGGYYCPSATINPYLPCGAGYYCRTGAKTAAPMQNSDAYECPVGHYCPEQSTEPTKCPAGTYSNTTRLMNTTDCTPCTMGNLSGSLSVIPVFCLKFLDRCVLTSTTTCTNYLCRLVL